VLVIERAAARLPARLARRLPISVRLGATFAAVFLAVLFALSTIAYWGLGERLRSELDSSLVGPAEALQQSGLGVMDLEGTEISGVESPDLEIQVISADGRVVQTSDEHMSSQPVLSAAQAAEARRAGGLFADVEDGDGEAFRALAVPLRKPSSRVLVMMAKLDSVEDAQAGLLRLALVLFPFAGLLAGAAGWLVARRGLRPIAHMTADAERISARAPFPRLAVPPSRDEVARLGTTLNGLLDRIEEARRREREFTADASHELRTPLAILRAELELARNHATDDRFVTALDSALEETDRLSHLVDDLLLLGRADAGHVTAQTLVGVAEVADGLLPGFRTLAGRRGITVSSVGDAVVRADPRALSRAVANLLDNAIRHAADGGNVALHITQRPDGTAITVIDDGPGVPPEEREQMVQRFAQLDRAHVRSGGAGLGLSIVSAVAAAQHGRLEISDAPSGRGLAVTLYLPVHSAGPVVT
jgi:heavy metal sensor kinase